MGTPVSRTPNPSSPGAGSPKALQDCQAELGSSLLSPCPSAALQLLSRHFSCSPWASPFQAFVPFLDGNFLHFSTRNLFMASAYFLFLCQVCLLDLLPPQHFPCPHLFIESNLCLFFFFFFFSFFPFFLIFFLHRTL